jgi:exonuclease VII small subunit
MKLTKAEGAKRDDLVANLEIAGGTLDDAITAYNAAVEAAAEAANTAIAAYNETLEGAREFVETLVERLDEEFGERSEKWQDSERGEAARALLNAWSELELDPVDDIEVDPIDEMDLPHRNDLEDAPNGTED